MLKRARAAVRRWSSPSFEAVLARQRGVWKDGATFVLTFDIETTADCAALPDVAAALRQRGIRASFACIGTLIDRHPDVHRALLVDGHELLGHTDTHPWHHELGIAGRFDELDERGLAREVDGVQRKLAGIGVHSVGFRAPHFGVQHTPRVYPVLRAADIRYSSSTIAARTPFGGAPFRVDGIAEIPLLGCPEHPWQLLDSWHCTTAPSPAHADPTELAIIYSRALAELHKKSAFGAVYWDPRVVLLPGYDVVLDTIAGFRGFRRTLAEIADRVN